LRTSARGHNPPESRFDGYGFRCVLVRSPTQALESATVATVRDQSFTNSLGMKFVPVPETKIFMCIHETRKKDYAAYAAANPSAGEAWKNQEREGVPVSSGDDHPVVGVDWDEVRAFCAWLSAKDGRTYRLPTDREWSFAVGIGRDEPAEAAPDSLGNKIPDRYPWGAGWPPPPGAGNYPDTVGKEAIPDLLAIEGYTDGYATTAPVMSFNVIRGGSWFQSESYGMLSSGRSFRPHNAPARDCGFRIVVVRQD
jgi:formylglycine-generating enzyme required for sulfatase activity